MDCIQPLRASCVRSSIMRGPLNGALARALLNLCCSRVTLLQTMPSSCCRRAVLLRRFMDSREEQPDPYQHMALVLTNLTRQKSGRQLLLEPGRGTFSALATQLSAPSALRRSGSANAIRNCCFCAEVRQPLDACYGHTCSCWLEYFEFQYTACCAWQVESISRAACGVQ